MFTQVHSRAFITLFTLALASTHLGCGDDEDRPTGASEGAQTEAGKTGSAGKESSSAGKSASAGKSGSGGGSAGKAGATAAASGGSSGSAPGAGPGGLSFTCTEEPTGKPVTCGGQTCQASTDFAMNPCIVPCCVNEGGKEVCGNKSTADMLATECSAPVKPAPECPDVDSQNGPLKGCCNTKQHKCGIISTLRPGCVTESTFIMFTDQHACGMDSAEDAGVGPDAG